MPIPAWADWSKNGGATVRPLWDWAAFSCLFKSALPKRFPVCLKRARKRRMGDRQLYSGSSLACANVPISQKYLLCAEREVSRLITCAALRLWQLPFRSLLLLFGVLLYDAEAKSHEMIIQICFQQHNFFFSTVTKMSYNGMMLRGLKKMNVKSSLRLFFTLRSKNCKKKKLRKKWERGRKLPECYITIITVSFYHLIPLFIRLLHGKAWTFLPAAVTQLLRLFTNEHTKVGFIWGSHSSLTRIQQSTVLHLPPFALRYWGAVLQLNLSHTVESDQCDLKLSDEVIKARVGECEGFQTKCKMVHAHPENQKSTREEHEGPSWSG